VARPDRINAAEVEVRKRIAAASRSRRSRKAPRAKPPTMIATRYALALGELVEGLDAAILDVLDPYLPRIAEAAPLPRTDARIARADAVSVELIERILGDVRVLIAERMKPTAQLALEFGAETARHNRTELNRQFQALIGIDLPGNDPHLADQLDLFRAGNVALITRMTDDLRARIGSTLTNAARQGLRVEEIRAQVQAVAGVSTSRAELIARDQVLKLNGELTQLRHRQAGITRYEWSTSRDERVRGTPGGKWPTPPGGGGNHYQLEGGIFEWSSPPIVDTRTGRRAHPGEDFQCRCVAVPVIELPD
jgi:SPP1 gp7 family putative phage head morphogenesis protein